DLLDPSNSLLLGEERAAADVPEDLVPALPVSPDLVWRPEVVAEAWREGLGEGPAPRPAPRAESPPPGPPPPVRAPTPGAPAAGARRGRERAAGIHPRRAASCRRVSPSRRRPADAEPAPPRRSRPPRARRQAPSGGRGPVRNLARPARLRLARARHRLAPG